MSEKKTTPIFSKEVLMANGWTEVKDDPAILLEKPIENRNPINSTPEDTDIKLVLHRYFNEPQFAVFFPDGGMLNFTPHSLKELQDFEKQLDFYDCPY